MNIPLVSVIVPNFNHEEYLEERFNSIVNQTCQDFEIILLDDGSIDNSQEILRKFSRHPKVTHLEINQKNAGSPFTQWEKGLELSKGEFIWIAESDDWADKDFLSKGVTLLQEHDAALFTCNSFLVNQEGEKVGTTRDWTSFLDNEVNVFDGKLFIKEYQIHKNNIYNASATLFKKRYWKNVNPDYKNFSRCGDYLFWSSMLLNGKLIYYKPELNYWRKHEQSVTAKNIFKIDIYVYENCKIFSFLREELNLTSDLPTGIYQRLVFSLKKISITKNFGDVLRSIYYLMKTDIRILKIVARDFFKKIF